jgi:hypothetical protein
MKKLFTIIIAISLFSSKAFSQDEIEPRYQKDSVIELNTTRLKEKKKIALSKQQKIQVKKYKHEAKLKKSAIQNNQGLTEGQKKEKLKQLHKENHKKLEAILTPAQKEEMKKRKNNTPRRGVTNMPNERTAK